MPDVRYPELESTIKKAGWELVRDHGTHRVFKKGDRTERLALGGAQTVGGGGLKEIYKRFGIEQSNGHALPKRKYTKQATVVVPPGSFADRLRKARTGAGMSQTDLCRHIDANQAMISSWEMGRSSPFNEDGEIKYKSSRPILAKLGELFGWEDIRLKAGVTIVPPREVAREQPKEVAEPALPPVRTNSELETFLKMLDTSDIIHWLMAKDRRIREVEIERDRLLRMGNKEDIDTLRRKAAAYDRIMAAAEEPKDTPPTV